MKTQTKLTEHFTLEEMSASGTAIRMGVKNWPNGEQAEALHQLCMNVLEPLRLRFGRIIITSGYRCPAVNKAVGGVRNSQHMRGEAADIRIPTIGAGLQMFDFIRDNCDFDQMLFESRRNTFGGRTYWLHVSCKRDLKSNRAMAIPNYQVWR